MPAAEVNLYTKPVNNTVTFQEFFVIFDIQL